MEKLGQETKTAAVQNPEYQEMGTVLLTPHTNRKTNQTSDKVKQYFQNMTMVWINHVLNISNSGRWDEIGKEDTKELTS